MTPPKDERSTLTIRLPPELYAKLKERAEKDQRTINNYVTKLLSEKIK